MYRWVGRVALVTGASSGIGAAIAKRLAQSGMTVVGCARNIDYVQVMSEDLKSSRGALHPLRCDLRTEDGILAMFSEIKSKYGGVDMCINNAGIGLDEGSILYGNTEQWREMTDVNVFASAICTREAIKSMRERKVDDGHIVQISSTFVLRHSPEAHFHWYGATKWMVRAMTDCLRMELRAEKSRIKVSAIIPGRTRTDFLRRMKGEDTAKKLDHGQASIEADKIADALISVVGTTEEVEIEEMAVMPVETSNS